PPWRYAGPRATRSRPRPAAPAGGSAGTGRDRPSRRRRRGSPRLLSRRRRVTPHQAPQPRQSGGDLLFGPTRRRVVVVDADQVVRRVLGRHHTGGVIVRVHVPG